MNDIEKLSLEVKEDPGTGDYYLIFPDHLLEKLQWSEGDTIVWTQIDQQSWSIHKLDKEDNQDDKA
jgi:hypothetical protein